MDDSTEKFFAFLNKQNAAIAAKEAEEALKKPEPDPVRLQREAERRAKWGQLRAREQPSKRPHRGRSVFGYTNLSNDD